MEKVLNLYKPVGVTPLELIEAFKEKNKEYALVKMGYAGRLDPLAEGVLLVLVGDENKKKEKYEKLPKEYVTEVLFGVTTDTYDSMGIIENIVLNEITLEKVLLELSQFEGQYLQSYPPYSSKTVNGKPLYYWSRKNKLDEIKIPTQQVTIYSIKHIAFKKMRTEQIVGKIVKNIALVHGDFRQKEIIKNWEEINSLHKNNFWPVVTLRIQCSSGTYIRTLAHQLGNSMKTGAIAVSIKRTCVGDYTIDNSVTIF